MYGSLIAQNGNETTKTLKKMETEYENIEIVAGTGRKAKISKDGERLKTDLSYPYCIVTDSNDDIIIGSDNHTIKRINMSTDEVTNISGTGCRGCSDGPCEVASFYVPYGMAMDSCGDLVVSVFVGQVFFV